MAVGVRDLERPATRDHVGVGDDIAMAVEHDPRAEASGSGYLHNLGRHPEDDLYEVLLQPRPRSRIATRTCCRSDALGRRAATCAQKQRREQHRNQSRGLHYHGPTRAIAALTANPSLGAVARSCADTRANPVSPHRVVSGARPARCAAAAVRSTGRDARGSRGPHD